MKKFKNDLEIAKFLLKIEVQAYAAVKRQKVEVKDKNVHDLVTNYDTFIEKFLLSKLNGAFTGVKVVSEEFNSSVAAEGEFFVIDPIDGTCNFANGLEMWGIQVAYVRSNEVAASAIFMPFYGKFFAAKGFGAFKNGKRLACQKRDLEHSFISLDINVTERFSAIWLKVAPLVLHQRFSGASCRNFTLLAEGKIGVNVIIEKAHPWDLLPGLLLAEEAGCVTKTVAGNLICATTEENAAKIADILKDFPC